MTPRVSVVLPTRNRVDKLARAVSGVSAQSFRDFELIVVVDGSTDGTLPWLRACGARAHVLVMERPGGAAAARNRGLEYARGELVAFLDDDDVWRSSYLEAQVAQLDVHPKADLSYSDHVEIDPAGRESRPDTQPLFTHESPLVWLLTESFIHTLSVVVCRRQVFNRFGGFDPRWVIVHDLDWYARVLAGGGSFVRLPSTLVERSVPGGLVTLHRSWCREERQLLTRAFEHSPKHRKHERMVRAYRSLFFARVALAKGDLRFGLSQLSDAFLYSAHWTTRVAALRLWRRFRLGRLSTTEGCR